MRCLRSNALRALVIDGKAQAVTAENGHCSKAFTCRRAADSPVAVNAFQNESIVFGSYSKSSLAV